jgi:predicted nucleotidyltransferase
MRIIFSTVVGSTLYGLRGESSDVDVRKIALPSQEDLLGLSDCARSHWEGSGDDPKDTTIYSLAKFLSLAVKGNPTIVEMFGIIPTECVLVETAEWKDVRDFARKNLVTKKIIPSFFGYLHDQFTRVKERKAQNNRTEMIEKFGYDVKCSSHCYRLAVQAIQWMETGLASIRMSGIDRGVALDMKNGKYTYDHTVELIERIIEEMRWAEKNCTLRDEPDMELVNQYCIDVHRDCVVP